LSKRSEAVGSVFEGQIYRWGFKVTPNQTMKRTLEAQPRRSVPTQSRQLRSDDEREQSLGASSNSADPDGIKLEVVYEPHRETSDA